MSNDNYPKPPGHKTFQFQSVTISSDFDSGNCCNVEKIGINQFNLWIATDHSKNNYRTWFHFSIKGIAKGTTVSFNLKNMQNQSRLLNEGLVPVYRQDGSDEWKRVSEKVNTNAIEYTEGWIEWTFKHNFKSNQKHYFAFFYPWSNQENSQFLTQIQEKAKQIPDMYFYRGSISRSIEGRNIQFLVISSNKHKISKQEPLMDQNLWKNQKKPHTFSTQKPAIILSARVHPGQVPSSHVMTGILKTLVEPDGPGKLLRDEFVFYVFPILNPDGVARGHYRVDTNGINLNRCYLTPSPKQQPSIYSIRKLILHLHEQNRFFAYLDLHAHASRKGTFIYGNCSNQLMKQVKACIFPKLLSMNSIDFEYEGSNFTQKNMYSKDRGDHISKEGSGRVAMFKATKNAYCWTMECNYNISRINNVLEPRKNASTGINQVDVNSLDYKLIAEYKQPQQIEAKEFFTIATYHKLGREICETFLDLIQKNPQSRIDNPNNYFKSVTNVKMNLAVALLRMAPNRFEANFRKVYSGIANSQNQQIIKNSLKALYYLVIKGAKIANINNYIKSGDQSEVEQPKKQTKKPIRTINFRSRQTRYNSIRSSNQISLNSKNLIEENMESQKILNQEYNTREEDEEEFKCLVTENPIKAQIQDLGEIKPQNSNDKDTKGTENSDQLQNIVSSKVVYIEKHEEIKKVTLKLENFRMIGINSRRKFNGPSMRETAKSCNQKPRTIFYPQEGAFYTKIINQELTCNIEERGEEQRKIMMRMIRKGPSFMQ